MKHVCPHCDKEDNVKETIFHDEFQYGSGEKAVTLTASVPVMTCSKCEESWTDYRAENIKHRMICELFGDRPVEPRKLTTYDFHEVLHTCHILNELINDQLVEHPAVSQTPVLAKAAEKAADEMGRLYQAVGTIHFAMIERESKVIKDMTKEVKDLGKAIQEKLETPNEGTEG